MAAAAVAACWASRAEEEEESGTGAAGAAASALAAPHSKVVIDSRTGQAIHVRRDLVHEGELPPPSRKDLQLLRGKFMTKAQRQQLARDDPLKTSVVQLVPGVRVVAREMQPLSEAMFTALRNRALEKWMSDLLKQARIDRYL